MQISFNYYPDGKKKALTMSYDDGQIYDRRLIEIFNKYGIKGTFHLNSGKFDSEPYLNSNEISDLFEGHEISAHSLNHPSLTMIPNETLVDEIIVDRKQLEDLANYIVRGMSYPFGDYNKNLIETLPLLGIEYSRTVNSHGNFNLPENFLAWDPTCHHDQNLIEKYKEFKNLSEWKQMPLFYVWGHSFEFDRNDNWDLIEEFCKMIADDDLIWYASNIEILDYIKALRNLKFSINRDILFNPSATTVWIGVEGQAVKIEPGQSLAL